MEKVLVQFRVPGVSTKQFDQAWDDLRAAGQTNPKGLLHHMAAHQDNNLVVIDVWESQEEFAKFGETLGPIMAKNGIEGQPTITPVHYELYGTTVLV